jgi:phage shock protein E
MTLKNLALLLLTVFSFSAYSSERADIAWQKIEAGALLVDVRTPAEFNEKHLAGAVNYPLSTVHTAFSSINKGQPIVVYCRSGNRSGQAQQFLIQSGYSNVHNGGGLNELLAAQK